MMKFRLNKIYAALAASFLVSLAPATSSADSSSVGSSLGSNKAPSLSEDAVAASANTATAATDIVIEKTPAIRQDDADLWQRIRRGFAMDPLASPMVEEREQWYAARPDYIRRFVERGSKYMHHIVEEVERRNMPTEIVLLPIIESAFNPQAHSTAAASGMWQFIPSTGKHFGLKQDWMADHRRDVLRSTDAALDYLQKLHGMFNSWELALAAYNCGEGCVGRAIAANKKAGLATDFLSLNLPNETKLYVPKLIAVKNIVLSPANYGIELNSVSNQPYFIKVAAPEKMDVKLAARLAEMPEADFAALNPAFNKPVASGAGYFLVPTELAETFKTNLDIYRSLNGPMVSWQTVTAKQGESIDRVAKRYGMTGSYLRATNRGLKERKGKFTQSVTFMVPMSHQAKMIDQTLDKKVALRPAGISVAKVATSPEIITANLAPEPGAVTSPASIPYDYQVQSGDTLFAIAKRYGLTVDAVKKINNLRDNQVQLGQVLKLIDLSMPGDTAPVTVADANLKLASGAATASSVAIVTTAKAAPLRSTMKVSAPAKPKNYTVRSGDTLVAIADKFDVDLDDLLRWNKLSKKGLIKPGAKLRVS